MSKKKNDTSFLVQGSILAIASLVSRVIGLVYRIPLTAIIGDHGNDYYSCAYEIYSLLLLISILQSADGGIQDGFSTIFQTARNRMRTVYSRAPCYLHCYYRNSCLCDRIFWCGGADHACFRTPLGVYALQVLATNADHRGSA